MKAWTSASVLASSSTLRTHDYLPLCAAIDTGHVGPTLPLIADCKLAHESQRSGLLSQPAPPNYVTPGFPGLYWPLHAPANTPQYLYHRSDIWRFTLYWTLIIYGTSHIAASGYAFAVQWRHWKLMWIVPIVYLIWAGLQGILAGSVIGLM